METFRARHVYYSPTGTSRKIVKAIQSGLGLVYDDIDLTPPATEKKKHRFSLKDLAIIAAPVYGGRVASVAATRLNNIIGNGSPAVLVAVYGNREYEDALLELKEITTANGFKPIAAAAFIGEHSFDTPETPIATGRPDEDDIQLAKNFGEKIKTKLDNGLTIVEVPGNYPCRDRGDADARSPETNKKTCTLCGICANVCPTACIMVSDAVETNKEECTACTACVKYCPTGARHWENEEIIKVAKWLSTDYANRKEPEFYL